MPRPRRRACDHGPGRLAVGMLLGASLGCSASRNLYLVVVPVADLRTHPSAPAPVGTHDDTEESQLLYGERVRLKQTQGDWALVEAIEQDEWTHHHRWEGYPGWIERAALAPLPDGTHPPNDAVITSSWATLWRDPDLTETALRLPMGAALTVTGSAMGERWHALLPTGEAPWISRGHFALDEELGRRSSDQRRALVMRSAQALLGDPYLWGGRSAHTDALPNPTGLDCSGLVNVAYRTAGISLPRDAHEQYLRSRRIVRLQPADLIFLSAPDAPDRIVHVMLYAGNDELIEGPGTGQPIRRIRAFDRLGRSLRGMTPGQRIERQTVFFGSYLN